MMKVCASLTEGSRCLGFVTRFNSVFAKASGQRCTNEYRSNGHLSSGTGKTGHTKHCNRWQRCLLHHLQRREGMAGPGHGEHAFGRGRSQTRGARVSSSIVRRNTNRVWGATELRCGQATHKCQRLPNVSRALSPMNFFSLVRRLIN